MAVPGASRRSEMYPFRVLNPGQVQKWSFVLEKTTDFELDLVYLGCYHERSIQLLRPSPVKGPLAIGLTDHEYNAWSLVGPSKLEQCKNQAEPAA
jgi:hypothetical protein